MAVPHLLSAGEAFEDLVFVRLDRIPAPGEEVRTDRFTTSIGGGAPITDMLIEPPKSKLEKPSGST